MLVTCWSYMLLNNDWSYVGYLKSWLVICWLYLQCQPILVMSWSYNGLNNSMTNYSIVVQIRRPLPTPPDGCVSNKCKRDAWGGDGGGTTTTGGVGDPAKAITAAIATARKGHASDNSGTAGSDGEQREQWQTPGELRPCIEGWRAKNHVGEHRYDTIT